MKFVLFAVFLMSYCLALRSNKQRCLVLALEGGGTKGAYQAGALKAMSELLPPEEIRYDVISGVSVGSLNGLGLAATEKGKEKEAISMMADMWIMIEKSNVYCWWPWGGIIRGFIDKISMFDNSAFYPYVQEQFKKLGGKIHRMFTMGSVDAQTGKFIVHDERKGADLIPLGIVSSAAVPGLFAYIKSGDKILIDGGVTDNLNLKAAINRCREIVGDDDERITIDAILTNPFDPKHFDMREEYTYNLYFRSNSLKDQMKTMYYLNNTIKAFPKIDWRYIIIPKKDLPNYPYMALSFNRETLQKELDIGVSDATDVISRRPVPSALLPKLKSPRRNKVI